MGIPDFWESSYVFKSDLEIDNCIFDDKFQFLNCLKGAMCQSHTSKRNAFSPE